MGFEKRFLRTCYGIDTCYEFLLATAGKVARSFSKGTDLYSQAHARRIAEKFTKSKFIQIRDVKLPLLSEERKSLFFSYTFEDVFLSYAYLNDSYDEKTFDKYDPLLPEGFYGLVNDEVNVTVEPGDIVIDAGSWIGDFAAYASVKGATTYAFEPSDENFAYLIKTAELNKNIIPVKKGLADEVTERSMFYNSAGHSSASSFLDKSEDLEYTEGASSVEITTVDDFVRENKLSRVDFIKSDIEGFERNMLAGAQETLKKFAPKLALCTYHLPDDPEVMARLIKQANPAYNIVQKRMKLFASVPK